MIINKFFLLFFFLSFALWAVDLPFPGRFSQRFTFKLISIESSRYYHKGFVTDESSFSAQTNRNTTVGKNFIFSSRSAYLHDYFSVLLDYQLNKREVNNYDGNSVILRNASQTKLGHEITPSVFGIFRPARVGLSYHYGLGQELLQDEILTSLRPTDALSVHFQLYQDYIPKTALGLGALYQFSFQPNLPRSEIWDNLFHRVDLLVHIYFTYYVHFRLKYSWEYNASDFSTTRIGNDGLLGNPNSSLTTDVFNVNLSHRSRHYLEYLFIYNLLEEFSVSLSIFQLLYANFESPILGFSVSISYNIGTP